MCGNSVCPPLARAIVAANYAEQQVEFLRGVRAIDADQEMRQFRELAALRVALKEAQEILNWALEQQT